MCFLPMFDKMCHFIYILFMSELRVGSKLGEYVWRTILFYLSNDAI